MSSYDEELTRDELVNKYKYGNGSISEDEAKNLAYKNGIDWKQFAKENVRKNEN
jgi:hypothetical protein